MATKTKKEKSAFDQLSDKHKLFVSHYCGDCFGNGTKAYMKTYPNAKYDTARSKSAELVAKDNIKRAIDEKYKEVYAEIQSETEKAKTYQLIKNLSECTIDQVINLEDGTLSVKNFSEIPEEAIHFIESIQMDERQNDSSYSKNLKVKMINKLSALKLRSDVQGLTKEDDNKQTVEIVITPAERPE